MAESEKSYQVVARRFRPKTFEEVVGQDAILQSLRSALQAGRVPHAFLFSGSRGVGKTTSARILARALNCERGPTPEPCGVCASCTSILAGSNPDVVEIDAASNNLVDDIRELRDRVSFASMGSRYKVYILDEVHMLTRSAFNAFLKTLEEPPQGVVFVLATTELHKVPETIRSRCQVLLFRRLGESEIAARLRAICEREQLAIGEDVLAEIARGCRGGMRDAETMLERVLPVAREAGAGFDLAAFHRLTHRVGIEQSIDVVADLLSGSARVGLRFIDDCAAAGVDERETLGDLLDVLRALLLLKVDDQQTGLLSGLESLRERLVPLAATADLARIDAMIQASLHARERLRRQDDRRLILEIAMVRMAQAGALATLAEIAAELRGEQPNVQAAVRPTVQNPAVSATATRLPIPKPAFTAASEVPAAPGLIPEGSLKERLAARVQKDRPVLLATLELCELEGPNQDGLVVLKVNTDRKLHRDRLASDGVQQELRGYLRDILGREVRLHVADAKSGSAMPADTVQSPLNEPEPKRPLGPTAKKIAERFDGDVIDSGGDN